MLRSDSHRFGGTRASVEKSVFGPDKPPRRTPLMEPGKEEPTRDGHDRFVSQNSSQLAGSSAYPELSFAGRKQLESNNDGLSSPQEHYQVLSTSAAEGTVLSRDQSVTLAHMDDNGYPQIEAELDKSEIKLWLASAAGSTGIIAGTAILLMGGPFSLFASLMFGGMGIAAAASLGAAKNLENSQNVSQAAWNPRV